MPRYFWILALWVAATAAAQQAVPPPKPAPKVDTDVTLAPGDGAPAVAAACSQCHTLARITTRQNTRPGWRQVVDDMIENNGADLDPAAEDAAVDYLVAHYGRTININHAAAADLVAVLQITPDQAAAIVAYRTQNGDFHQWQELEKVPGLDEKTVTPWHEALTF